ncbi:hypothetical protein JW906_02960 [bacterium]|nr:hypothetical protein [bacterium]
MEKSKRKLVFKWIGFFCSLLVVIMSAVNLKGALSNAQLLALIAGSFGAGTMLANLIRDYRARRHPGG